MRGVFFKERQNMYNVTLYYNTGFNSINVPDSPSLLYKCTAVNFPALKIVQDRIISEIQIKAKWKQVKNADYVRLQDNEDLTELSFYSIDDVTMLSTDVAKISIVFDAWTTAGGVNGISEFLDGMCERHHVAKKDDTWGKYSQDDPYLSPSKPLLISYGDFYFTSYRGQASDETAFIESTVDLQWLTDHKDVTVYESAKNELLVPAIPAPTFTTTCHAGVVSPYVINATDLQTTMPNSVIYMRVYDKNIDDDFNFSLQKLRALGLESVIKNSWVVPQEYWDNSRSRCNEGSRTEVTNLCGRLQSIPCYAIDSQSDIKGKALPEVSNERCNYGQWHSVNFVAIASGNSMKYRLEDVCAGPSEFNICMWADPRPNGSPIYAPEFYKGATAGNNILVNSVKGLTWQKLPIIYYDKSGSEIDTVKFNTCQRIKNENAAMNEVNSALSTVGSLTSNIEKGNIAGSILSGVTGGTTSAFIARKRQNEAMQELQNFEIAQTVVVPEVNFPRSESVRDYFGNGLYIYTVSPAPEDLKKFDKILTMYGYRDTIPIEKSFLTNRSKFNYIKAGGVSVKLSSDFPIYIRNEIASQFKTGLRIWHVLPDASCYTDGSNT